MMQDARFISRPSRRLTIKFEKLDPVVKARIEKNVPEDLTKIDGTKLLSHF